VGPVDLAPSIRSRRINLQGNPISLPQIFSHVFTPDQRRVADDGDLETKGSQQVDLMAEIGVQRGLAIGHESEVVDLLIAVPRLLHLLLYGPKKVPGLIELLPLHAHLDGTSQLTVDTGVAADLGRHVVDPQAASQSSGRYGSKSKGCFHLSLLSHII
jgi:hypothetical protein